GRERAADPPERRNRHRRGRLRRRPRGRARPPARDLPCPPLHRRGRADPKPHRRGEGDTGGDGV
ncbi:MAG: hypothetical protein AVDCRST_MAG05-2910, partial [uncultured Rubrobacteraceae bacterium]